MAVPPLEPGAGERQTTDSKSYELFNQLIRRATENGVAEIVFRIRRVKPYFFSSEEEYEIGHMEKIAREPPHLHRRLGRPAHQYEVTLVRLWRKKRAEVEPEDLSGNPLRSSG